MKTNASKQKSLIKSQIVKVNFLKIQYELFIKDSKEYRNTERLNLCAR